MRTFGCVGCWIIFSAICGKLSEARKVIRCKNVNGDSPYSDQLCPYNEVADISRVYVGYSESSQCLAPDTGCLADLNQNSNEFNDVITRCHMLSACMTSLYASSIPISCNNERKQSNLEVIEYSCVMPVKLQYKVQCVGRLFTEPLCDVGEHASIYRTYLGRGGVLCGSSHDPVCVYISNGVVDQDIRNKCSGRRSCRDLLVSGAWILCDQQTVNAAFVVIQYTCEGQVENETVLPPTEINITFSPPGVRISEDTRRVVYVVVPVILLALTIGVSVLAIITWKKHRRADVGDNSAIDRRSCHPQACPNNSDHVTDMVTSDYVTLADNVRLSNRLSGSHNDYVHDNEIYRCHIRESTGDQFLGQRVDRELGQSTGDDLLIADNPNYAKVLPVTQNGLLLVRGPSQRCAGKQRSDSEHIYCDVNIDERDPSGSDEPVQRLPVTATRFAVKEDIDGDTGYSEAIAIDSPGDVYSKVKRT